MLLRPAERPQSACRGPIGVPPPFADASAPNARTLDLKPVAGTPLCGAFGGTVAAATPPASACAWDGPIATPKTLGEIAEQRFISKAGDRAVMLPYRDFDPRRPPVILVHGLMNPAANYMGELADRLHAAGKQVFVVYYHDTRDPVGKTGKEVARQLLALRERYYPEGTPVDIMGLCIGGVVTRAALNYLQQPGWLGDGADLSAAPRAGFGTVRFRAVDTVWDGFFHEAPEDRGGTGVKVAQAVLTPLGLGGAMELRATSDTFEHLYDVRLDGVDFRHVGVAKPQDSSLFRGIPQYDDREALLLARYVMTGTIPADIRVRNWGRALEQEARYADFKARLAARLAAEGIGVEQPSEALRRALVESFNATVPSYPVLKAPDKRGKRAMRAGWLSHILALKDDKRRGDDLFDHLLEELGTTAGAGR
ncbi:MAG: hypothetical protein HY903_11345 [Deltaproteobacteria bacterium]|nr:hypothetical protein [Deltaproteobacteria bacterium]